MTMKQEQAVADRDTRVAKARKDTKYAIKTYEQLRAKCKEERKSYLDRISHSSDSKTIKYLMQKIEHVDNNIRICEKQIKILELQKEIEEHRNDNFNMKIGLITV